MTIKYGSFIFVTPPWSWMPKEWIYSHLQRRIQRVARSIGAPITGVDLFPCSQRLWICTPGYPRGKAYLKEMIGAMHFRVEYRFECHHDD